MHGRMGLKNRAVQRSLLDPNQELCKRVVVAFLPLAAEAASSSDMSSHKDSLTDRLSLQASVREDAPRRRRGGAIRQTGSCGNLGEKGFECIEGERNTSRMS